MREDEAVHAHHHGKRNGLGELERLHVQVDRFLVRFGIELDPTAVPLGHCIRVVVPDVDRRADRPIRDRHDDRQAEPGGVVQRLGHVEEALARGRGVRARAGGGRADARGQSRKLRFDVQELALPDLALAHEIRERLDDVRLWRDRVGAYDLGTTIRHSACDSLGALDLATHR
jgi:hypothetical protein